MWHFISDPLCSPPPTHAGCAAAGIAYYLYYRRKRAGQLTSPSAAAAADKSTEAQQQPEVAKNSAGAANKRPFTPLQWFAAATRGKKPPPSPPQPVATTDASLAPSTPASGGGGGDTNSGSSSSASSSSTPAATPAARARPEPISTDSAHGWFARLRAAAPASLTRRQSLALSLEEQQGPARGQALLAAAGGTDVRGRALLAVAAEGADAAPATEGGGGAAAADASGGAMDDSAALATGASSSSVTTPGWPPPRAPEAATAGPVATATQQPRTPATRASSGLLSSVKRALFGSWRVATPGATTARSFRPSQVSLEGIEPDLERSQTLSGDSDTGLEDGLEAGVGTAAAAQLFGVPEEEEPGDGVVGAGDVSPRSGDGGDGSGPGGARSNAPRGPPRFGKAAASAAGGATTSPGGAGAGGPNQQDPGGSATPVHGILYRWSFLHLKQRQRQQRAAAKAQDGAPATSAAPDDDDSGEWWPEEATDAERPHSAAHRFPGAEPEEGDAPHSDLAPSPAGSPDAVFTSGRGDDEPTAVGRKAAGGPVPQQQQLPNPPARVSSAGGGSGWTSSFRFPVGRTFNSAHAPAQQDAAPPLGGTDAARRIPRVSSASSQLAVVVRGGYIDSDDEADDNGSRFASRPGSTDHRLNTAGGGGVTASGKRRALMKPFVFDLVSVAGLEPGAEGNGGGEATASGDSAAPPPSRRGSSSAQRSRRLSESEATLSADIFAPAAPQHRESFRRMLAKIRGGGGAGSDDDEGRPFAPRVGHGEVYSNPLVGTPGERATRDPSPPRRAPSASRIAPLRADSLLPTWVESLDEGRSELGGGGGGLRRVGSTSSVAATKQKQGSSGQPQAPQRRHSGALRRASSSFRGGGAAAQQSPARSRQPSAPRAALSARAPGAAAAPAAAAASSSAAAPSPPRRASTFTSGAPPRSYSGRFAAVVAPAATPSATALASSVYGRQPPPPPARRPSSFRQAASLARALSVSPQRAPRGGGSGGEANGAAAGTSSTSASSRQPQQQQEPRLLQPGPPARRGSFQAVRAALSFNNDRVRVAPPEELAGQQPAAPKRSASLSAGMLGRGRVSPLSPPTTAAGGGAGAALALAAAGAAARGTGAAAVRQQGRSRSFNIGSSSSSTLMTGGGGGVGVAAPPARTTPPTALQARPLPAVPPSLSGEGRVGRTTTVSDTGGPPSQLETGVAASAPRPPPRRAISIGPIVVPPMPPRARTSAFGRALSPATGGRANPAGASGAMQPRRTQQRTESPSPAVRAVVAGGAVAPAPLPGAVNLLVTSSNPAAVVARGALPRR